MVILDQLDLPEGVTLHEAAVLARAAGDIGEGELVVLVNREEGRVEYGTAYDAILAGDATAAPDQPTDGLGRAKSAPAPADAPSATPRAALDLSDPAVQSALEYLRGLKLPLEYGFDAETSEYLVRHVGNALLGPFELARHRDPRVLAERARSFSRNPEGQPA